MFLALRPLVQFCCYVVHVHLTFVQKICTCTFAVMLYMYMLYM